MVEILLVQNQSMPTVACYPDKSSTEQKLLELEIILLFSLNIPVSLRNDH